MRGGKVARGRRVIMQRPSPSFTHNFYLFDACAARTDPQEQIHQKHSNSHTHTWLSSNNVAVQENISKLHHKKKKEGRNGKQDCVNARHKCQLPDCRCCSGFSMSSLRKKPQKENSKTILTMPIFIFQNALIPYCSGVSSWITGRYPASIYITLCDWKKKNLQYNIKQHKRNKHKQCVWTKMFFSLFDLSLKQRSRSISSWVREEEVDLCLS